MVLPACMNFIKIWYQIVFKWSKLMCIFLGTDHNTVHWIFGPYIQQLFRLLGWKRCSRGRWKEYWWFRKLCRRIMVGCDYCNYDRIWRYCSKNLDGQDRCFMFQCFCYIIFRPTCGEYFEKSCFFESVNLYYTVIFPLKKLLYSNA